MTAPPPPPEELLQQGRDDISADGPDDIPKMPDDPAGSIAGRAASMLLLGALGALMAVGGTLGKLLPSGRSGRSGGHGSASGHGGEAGGSAAGAGRASGGLSGWISRKVAAISERLLAARFKEIARLMRMLESDPDQGLRYALPLSGSAHRGSAAPGDRLTPRSTQFNLGMLRGGQAGDAWDVPDDYQARLAAQYRQAANREIGLGRFRRAAYIFAVLLGDYHAAANTLRQGRHFREAAVIYKDHLHNTAEAARCLEHGGLLLEAIPLYEEQGQFEKVGDLYAVLRQAPEAEAAWRKAVAKACESGQRLAAAGLLENKLKAIDEAVELLAADWPDGPQAVECTKARIALLGRAGRHEQSRKLLGLLRTQPEHRHMLGLIGAMTGLARDYPDQTTRHDLADTVRVVASGALVVARPSDAAVVARALARLCPEDRLLKRDADRFSAAWGRQWEVKSGRPVLPPRPSARDKRTAQVSELHLPGEIRWTTFAAAHGVFYAAGYERSDVQTMPWLLVHDRQDKGHLIALRQWYAKEEPLLMAIDPIHEHHVFLTTLRGRRLTPRELAVGSGTFRGGTPDWAPDRIAGVTYDSMGQAWMLVVVNDQLQVACYSPEGELRHSQLMFLMPFEEIEPVPLMLIRGSDLWFAVHDGIACCRADGQMLQAKMPSPIRSLSATPPHSVIRLAVTLEEGGLVVMAGRDWPGGLRFAEGMVQPLASFTSDGHLVAATAGAGRVYALRDGRVQHVGDFDAPAEPPLAVLGTGTAREFAVATEHKVHVYRIA